MIDLNGGDFAEREYLPVFNKGVAGRVEKVTIRIDKRGIDDTPGAPLYKINAIDSEGAEVNAAFFFKEESDTRNNGFLVNRAVHLARAVVGGDYKFETFETYAATLDYLFKLVTKESIGKTFTIFCTYGNIKHASQYMGLRFFEFIEAGNVSVEDSRLVKKKDDLLVKVEEDALPSTSSDFEVVPGKKPTTESWI